ncbi:MAG: archaemetzincin family Zn-dependent metalloprotease [Candidatus Thorarchaeota archaeon]
MGRIIYLQKIGDLKPTVLPTLKRQLQQELRNFNIIVEVSGIEMGLTESEFNKSKNQFNASNILNLIGKSFPIENYFRILGVLDKDIYSRNLNFVFGLASMQSGVAVVSITRLSGKFYKKSGLLYRKLETEKDIEERILKEAIHELGHTFGLYHCNNLCIMRFSNNLKEVDEKPPIFCNSCLISLKKVFNYSNT